MSVAVEGFPAMQMTLKSQMQALSNPILLALTPFELTSFLAHFRSKHLNIICDLIFLLVVLCAEEIC